MRITARGWKRDSGPTLIMDHKLAGAARRENPNSYKQNDLYLDRTTGGVELKIGPAQLTLGGRYQIQVELSNEDIVELFLSLSADVSKYFDEVFSSRQANDKLAAEARLAEKAKLVPSPVPPPPHTIQRRI